LELILSLSGVNPIPTPATRKPERLSGQVARGWRQTRRVFHVLVGLAFFALAAAGATLSFAEWRAHVESPANGIWRFGLLAGFTLFLVIFGLYSFLKARSVR
jgi:hypothetical protein